MNVLAWNINGLKRKIVDEDFIDFITNYDLIFLNETWISKHETLNFDIPGFCCELIAGNKARNTTKGRYSGGIAFYYRSELKQYVNVLHKNQAGILWIKVSSELFPFDQDVYICHIYVPPNDSRVSSSSNIDLYDQLEQDIIKYNNLGKIYISGDLNAHTSTSSDYFEYDKFLDQNLIFLNTLDIPQRANSDRILDYYGRYLLELCQCTGLLIANGRLHNDRNNGKFTFCSHQGQSTVDYLLFNFCDFDTLSHFEILQFNEFSDHAPLSFNFYLKPRNKEHERLNTQTDPEISRKMVWDNAKIDDFKMLLNNSMDGIHRLTTDINNEPVDDVVKNFTQFRYLWQNVYK